MAQQPLVCQGLLHDASRSHSDTRTLSKIPLEEWSARRRDITQHSQETDIHVSGGIRTHNSSKRATTDPRLRPRGHWNRQILVIKVHPITGHEGPEGEQMYSSTLPSTSALDRGGWSTPRPGRFIPQESPGTHCIGGWVGPRAGLDGCGKSHPHRDSIPGQSSPKSLSYKSKLLRRDYNICINLLFENYFQKS